MIMGSQAGASSNSESAIWARLIETQNEPISADTARFLLAIRLSEADQARMQELMDKSNEGTLTAEDEAEFDSYLNIADLLTVMHSQARTALRGSDFRAPRDPPGFVNQELIRTVWNRANRRCEYCHMPAMAHAGWFHLDHIVAIQHGGLTAPENLALACGRCNRRKGPNIAGRDPETGEIVQLFNPRWDRWIDHFEWNGPDLIGTMYAPSCGAREASTGTESAVCSSRRTFAV